MRIPEAIRLASGVTLLVLLFVGAIPAAAEKPEEKGLRLDEPAAEDPAVAEVLEWRQERHERLTRPDGWLTLAGLFWLHEGENTAGSDPQSDVVLPEAAPAKAGVLRKTGEEVVFEAAAGVEARIGGEPARRAVLASDAAGEATLVELGTVSFHLIERQERLGVRVRDREHPTLVGFEGLEYYPVDLGFRVEAAFEPYDPPKSIPVPNVLGEPVEQESPGAVVWRMASQEHRLDALPGGDDGELFLVFGDKTNGKETYGGGRFLYTPPPAGGRVTVDFNRAYNPPCAFSPYATCPLPPPQNRLSLAVRAGEKKTGDGAH